MSGTGCTSVALERKSYLMGYDEVTWGVKPVSPTYYFIPVSRYTNKWVPKVRQARPATGLFSKGHNQRYNGSVKGNIGCSLYGYKPSGLSVSLAQKLLDWSFLSHEDCFTPSKGFEWYQGPGISDLRHEGVRVNGATLQGSEDSSIITLDIDCVGKSEDDPGSQQPIPDDMHNLTEYAFPNCTFNIDGSEILARAFILSARYNQLLSWRNSSTPTIIAKQDRDLQLVLVPVLDSNTYTAMNRAYSQDEFPVVITMKGLHDGTGSGGTDFTRATITAARASFVGADRQSFEQLLFQPLTFSLLKPDSSDLDLTIDWDEV